MERKLYCSPNKKLCGVCGGIADYFNIDPTLIRIGVAFIGIYTAVIPTLIVYLIVALIIPKPPENYYQLYNNTSKKLTKGSEKKISGVCSGIAEYFSIDPTVVRLIFVLVILLFGSGLTAYIICAILMPQPFDNYNQQNPPFNENQNNNNF